MALEVGTDCWEYIYQLLVKHQQDCQDNIDSGYAVTMEWKNISWQLESKIDEAFNNRGKSDLVRNSRKRRERNS